MPVCRRKDREAASFNGNLSDWDVSSVTDTDSMFREAASFSEGMGVTNMVARTWNAGGQITTVQIFDALDVRAPEPAMVDPEPTGEPDFADRSLLAIRMWSGFEPESIPDAQLLASLGLDYPGADIPSWVMTELGVLVSNGEVTVEQFKTAMEYVLEHS